MSTPELISATTNAAMVQLPGRHNPSMCIQGDTLLTLADSVHKAAAFLLKNSDDEEMVEWIVYANNVLGGLVSEYNRVAKETGRFHELDAEVPLLEL